MNKLLIGAVAIFAVASANAKTVTFTGTSKTYTTANATATVTTASTGSPGALNYVSGSGIGVGSTNYGGAGMGYVGGRSGGSYVTTETITVTFDKQVRLNDIWFHSWANTNAGGAKKDRVVLTYSGGTSGTGKIILKDSGLGTGNGSILDNFAIGLNLKSFKLTPVQRDTTIRTDVLLNKMDFNVPAAVPVPAAAWLFGSGLVGLVSIGRRRRAA